MKRISLLRTLLIGVIVSTLLITCTGASGSTGYLKYEASRESFFSNATFEYPDTWSWVIDMDGPSANSGWMYASNPDSEDPYGGFIVVHSKPLESHIDAISALEIAISRHLEQKKVMRAEIISDRMLEIDGHDSRRIIAKQGPITGTEVPEHEPLIDESVYILLENSYYTVSLTILESERYGEFGRGFDHMINTIQFLP